MIFNQLPGTVFSSKCEIINMHDKNIYSYPIFKNGSSSLNYYAAQMKYKIIINEQIKKVNTIDIIIRNPMDRFISGVNTYVYNTKKENKLLDVKTIIYFVENYLFLNRHYAPQLSWLINLSRYTTETTKFRLNGMDSLDKFTPFHNKPAEENILLDSDIIRLRNNIHNEMYQRMDNLLLSLVGQTMTFKEILKYLKEQDPKAYEHVLS
jgi:hypothetical protein